MQKEQTLFLYYRNLSISYRGLYSIKIKDSYDFSRLKLSTQSQIYFFSAFDFPLLDHDFLLTLIALPNSSMNRCVRSIRTLSQCLACLLNRPLETYRCPILAFLTHKSPPVVQNGPHYRLAYKNSVFLMDTLVVGLVVFDNLAVDNVAGMFVHLSTPTTEDVCILWFVFAVPIFKSLFILIFPLLLLLQRDFLQGSLDLLANHLFEGLGFLYRWRRHGSWDKGCLSLVR